MEVVTQEQTDAMYVQSLQTTLEVKRESIEIGQIVSNWLISINLITWLFSPRDKLSISSSTVVLNGPGRVVTQGQREEDNSS